MKASDYVVLALFLVGIYYIFHLEKEPKIVEKEKIVRVGLSPHELDSMGLAIKLKVLAEFKPKTKIVPVEDTAKTNYWFRLYLQARDSLKGLAQADLTYHSDSVNTYGDTIDVRADCIGDTVEVISRPKARQLTFIIRDTVKVVEGDSFLEDALQAAAWFAIGRISSELIGK